MSAPAFPVVSDAALSEFETEGPSTSVDSTEAAPTNPVAPAAPAEVTFADLGLPEHLLRAVTDLGYTTPSAIQEKAIPALLLGQDITGVAQTGTGKTAAFGLPMLAAIDPSLRQVQALVLTPTRELAMQVADAISSMATHMPGLRVLSVYGGSAFQPQQKSLASGVQVVVGTPGRIIDHLTRKTLNLSGVRFLVLDEADEMLRMGFAEDVERILEDAPAGRQTALFSATMPPPIRRVAQQHMTNPVDIAVSRQSSTVENVRQTYAVVPFSQKVEALARILEVSDADATIVFTRTRDAAETVGSELIARGISAAAISGDVAQRERERIVERLRNGRLDVLVATDVAARGLDVERIDLVVNFDAPGEPEAYVHRIGRTGRAGRTGEALTFFTPRETSRLRAIERATRQKLEEIKLPTAADVAIQRATKVLTKASARAEVGKLETYRTAVETFLAQNPMTAAELAATLAALAAGDDGKQVEPAFKPSNFAADRGERSGDRGQGGRGDRQGRERSYAERTTRSGDRTSHDRPSFDRGSERPRTPRPAGTRYRVAVGHSHGVRPAGIVGAITGEGGINGKDLGRIDIFDTHSTVEISADLSADAMARIAGAKVSGQSLQIHLDSGDGAQAPRQYERAESRDRGYDRGDRGGYDRPARGGYDRGSSHGGGYDRPARGGYDRSAGGASSWSTSRRPSAR
ncbi:ATP-dependent helicase [Nakamurella silvestris]|nr:ATP-dependent helicase [Nakamurella silvestris]